MSNGILISSHVLNKPIDEKKLRKIVNLGSYHVIYTREVLSGQDERYIGATGLHDSYRSHHF